MSALIRAGWRAHEITDGGGQFQVLVRRSRRGAADAAGVGRAPTAQDRSIIGGGLKVPPAIERTGAVDSPANPRNSSRGHKTPMGPVSFDPDPAGLVAGGVSTPATAFGALPSVRAMGTSRPAMVVGVDTEFTTNDGVRVIDSYQFAVPDPMDPSVMVQVVILPLSQRRISLQAALWEVVKAAGLWRSPRVRDGVDDRGVRRDMVRSVAPAGKRGDAARAWIADPRALAGPRQCTRSLAGAPRPRRSLRLGGPDDVPSGRVRHGSPHSSDLSRWWARDAVALPPPGR